MGYPNTDTRNMYVRMCVCVSVCVYDCVCVCAYVCMSCTCFMFVCASFDTPSEPITQLLCAGLVRGCVVS